VSIEPNELRRRYPLDDPRALCRAVGLRVPQRGPCLIRCPSHDDKTPSCSVTIGPDATLRAHCFACGWSADALGLIAKVRGLDGRDFPRVMSEAAKLAGIYNFNESGGPRGHARPLRSTRAPRVKQAAPEPPKRAPLSLDGELAGVLVPLDAAAARDVACYLADRSLLDLAVSDGWLAINAQELAYRIEERVCAGGDPSDGDLGLAGLVCRLDNGWVPRFPAHRLVMPWRTPNGSIDTIQRRVLIGAPKQKYVFPAGRAPLHPSGIERLVPGAEIVFVEGAIDTLARRALDDANRVVLGLPGVDGWREEWAQLVRGRVVRVATDADEAGDRAADKLAPKMFAAGAVRVIRERREGGDWADALKAAA
jgi:DNA primase